MAATVAAIRGSLGEPTPQIFAQLTLANAVTRNVVFSHVTQVRSALPLPAPLPARCRSCCCCCCCSRC